MILSMNQEDDRGIEGKGRQLELGENVLKRVILTKKNELLCLFL